VAEAGRGDWILCQSTSNPYSDASALELRDESFQTGSLRVASYARPGKLFTANDSLILTQAGRLKPEAVMQVIEAVIGVLRASINE
jgi:hypothetical protein